MNPKNLPFEKALERLEVIVERLESGDAPLEESVKLFEEGIALRSRCLQLLQKAEERVKFLTESISGEPVLEPPSDAWEGEEDDDVD